MHSLRASWESHLTPAPLPAKLAPLTRHLTGAEQLDEENARRICWEWLNLHAGVRMTEWPVNLHTHMHANQSPNMCVHMCVSHKTLFPPIRMEALRAEILICFVFQKRVLAHTLKDGICAAWGSLSRERCLHWHLLWWTYFGAKESLLGWAPGWYPNSMKQWGAALQNKGRGGFGCYRKKKKLSRREGRRYKLGWELLWRRITGKEGLIEGPEGKGLRGEDICLTHFMKQVSSIVWCKPLLVTPLDHLACLPLLPALVQVELSSVESGEELRVEGSDSWQWGPIIALGSAVNSEVLPPGGRDHESVFTEQTLSEPSLTLFFHTLLCVPYCSCSVLLDWGGYCSCVRTLINI